MTIEPNTVLQHTPWCTIRPQKDGSVLYNSRTDELHLVPPTGVLAFELCDGLTSVSEITELLAQSLRVSASAVSGPLNEYFEQLLTRGALEVAS